MLWLSPHNSNEQDSLRVRQSKKGLKKNPEFLAGGGGRGSQEVPATRSNGWDGGQGHSWGGLGAFQRAKAGEIWARAVTGLRVCQQRL